MIGIKSHQTQYSHTEAAKLKDCHCIVFEPVARKSWIRRMPVQRYRLHLMSRLRRNSTPVPEHQAESLHLSKDLRMRSYDRAGKKIAATFLNCVRWMTISKATSTLTRSEQPIAFGPALTIVHPTSHISSQSLLGRSILSSSPDGRSWQACDLLELKLDGTGCMLLAIKQDKVREYTLASQPVSGPSQSRELDVKNNYTSVDRLPGKPKISSIQ